jgi:hypothetical protein
MFVNDTRSLCTSVLQPIVPASVGTCTQDDFTIAQRPRRSFPEGALSEGLLHEPMVAKCHVRCLYN